MAKTAKFNGGKTRTVVHGQKGKRPEFPVNTAESNAQSDKQAMLIFSGLGLVTVTVFALALLWGATQILGGLSTPPNWLSIIAGVVIISGSIFIVRSLIWLCFFAAIMFSYKSGAWKTQEHLCTVAIKWWRLFPGGATTAATLLAQSLVSRGQFDEAIKVGETQFQQHSKDTKASQNLAGMYVTLGMASQLQGNPKDSITWNDRAIEALNNSVEELTTKKNWFAKMAGGQATEWAGSLRTQLAVASFNNATSYFNLMNHRQAKLYYKKALEYANQAPNFPEKGDLIKASSDQLGRLKHA